MSEAENLRAIAEVAIAIAGFTGVVVALGSRTRGEWSLAAANNLWLLLSQALVVTLSAFLPILLGSAGIGERPLWRVSNGLLAIATWAVGGHMAFRMRYRLTQSASLLGRCLEYLSLAIGGVISVAQLVHSAGALPGAGPFLFLLALLFLLAASVANFWRLLMGSLVVEPR